MNRRQRFVRSIWSFKMKEKNYQIDSKFFHIHTTANGIVALCAIVACIIGILLGFYPKLLLIVILVAGYTAWNTFIAISNPQKVTIADDFVSFSAYGRTDSFELAELDRFMIREFPSAGKMYIRINQAGIFKGRYWLYTMMFSDGQELFRKLLEIERNIHPDSLKTQAYRSSVKYAEIKRRKAKTKEVL